MRWRQDAQPPGVHRPALARMVAALALDAGLIRPALRGQGLFGQPRQGPVIITSIYATSLSGFVSLLAVAKPASYLCRSRLFPAIASSVVVMLTLAPGARSP